MRKNSRRAPNFGQNTDCEACRFKLDLNPDHVLTDLAKQYPSTALPRLLGAACEKLVTDYLRSLRQCIDYNFGLQGVGGQLPRQYVLTVPAIWPDGAKNATRRCAKDAGMGNDILMISEPEAAAIYALERERAEGLVAGDTFVLCDAGGGSVHSR